jgi:hypothetical protein
MASVLPYLLEWTEHREFGARAKKRSEMLACQVNMASRNTDGDPPSTQFLRDEFLARLARWLARCGSISLQALKDASDNCIH